MCLRRTRHRSPFNQVLKATAKALLEGRGVVHERRSDVAGVVAAWCRVSGKRLIRRTQKQSASNLPIHILTTEPNAEVAAIHPRRSGYLATMEAREAWLQAPLAEALALLRPLPDNTLRVVARREAGRVGRGRHSGGPHQPHAQPPLPTERHAGHARRCREHRRERRHRTENRAQERPTPTRS